MTPVDPPKRAARRILVEWEDGSRHDFTRRGNTHQWDLAHTPPEVLPIQTADRVPMRVTGYDRFQLVRVLVNCVDGEE